MSARTLCQAGRCQRQKLREVDAVVSAGTVSAGTWCQAGRCQPGRCVSRDGVSGRSLREVDAVVTATPTVCV